MLKSKRFIMVTVLAMIMVFASMTSAFASEMYEPNDTMTSSVTIYPFGGFPLTAQISTLNDNDFYDFTATSSGYLTLNLTPPAGKNYDFLVWYNGSLLASGASAGSGAVESTTIAVTEGRTYVVQIASPNSDYSNTADYTFVCSFTSSYAAAYEPNDSNSAAAPINIYNGSATVASIPINTDVDYYKFTANSTGSLTMNLIPPSGINYNMYIYDRATGATVGSGLLSGGSQESVTFSATSGKEYTVVVFGASSTDYSTIPYQLYKN
jgi:hypothetical protein